MGLVQVDLTLFDQYISPSLLSSNPILSSCLVYVQADARIQRGYQRLSSSQGRGSEAGGAGSRYNGVLGQLMEKGQLSLDLIKANITELMAGGVDTVCIRPSTRVFVCVDLRPYTSNYSVTSDCFPSADGGAPAVCAVRAGSKPRGAREGEAAGEGVMGAGRRGPSESPAGGATTERNNQGDSQVHQREQACKRLLRSHVDRSVCLV